jgi:hypothetical protein
MDDFSLPLKITDPQLDSDDAESLRAKVDTIRTEALAMAAELDAKLSLRTSQPEPEEPMPPLPEWEWTDDDEYPIAWGREATEVWMEEFNRRALAREERAPNEDDVLSNFRSLALVADTADSCINDGALVGAIEWYGILNAGLQNAYRMLAEVRIDMKDDAAKRGRETQTQTSQDLAVIAKKLNKELLAQGLSYEDRITEIQKRVKRKKRWMTDNKIFSK